MGNINITNENFFVQIKSSSWFNLKKCKTQFKEFLIWNLKSIKNRIVVNNKKLTNGRQ